MARCRPWEVPAPGKWSKDHDGGRPRNQKKHKTVHVICANCIKTSCITLFGLANEYRELITLEKCKHCGTVGKLATNELAKTRPRPDTTKQLKLNWGKEKW